MCGVSPGRRWKSAIGIVRVDRRGRIGLDTASSTRIATAMSLGCVAMQASLTPMTRMLPAEAADGAAAAARLALVARLLVS